MKYLRRIKAGVCGVDKISVAENGCIRISGINRNDGISGTIQLLS
jgi:hypothetical protein